MQKCKDRGPANCLDRDCWKLDDASLSVRVNWPGRLLEGPFEDGCHCFSGIRMSKLRH